MTSNRKKRNPNEPEPLNFDHDDEKGPSDPFMTPADARGDNEDDQYYEEEEAMSPEEAKIRKEEGDL